MYGSAGPEKYLGTHRLMRHFGVGVEFIGPVGCVRVANLLKACWPLRSNETYWPRWQWWSQDTCGSGRVF